MGLLGKDSHFASKEVLNRTLPKDWVPVDVALDLGRLIMFVDSPLELKTVEDYQAGEYIHFMVVGDSRSERSRGGRLLSIWASPLTDVCRRFFDLVRQRCFLVGCCSISPTLKVDSWSDRFILSPEESSEGGRVVVSVTVWDIV